MKKLSKPLGAEVPALYKGLSYRGHQNQLDLRTNMTNKIEIEFIVDNPNEVRPALIDSSNILEEGYIPTEEETVHQFDKLFDNE